MRIAPKLTGHTLTAFVLLLTLSLAGDIHAQGHQLFNSQLPTGEIGRMNVARLPELAGVMQPVLLKVPKGANVAVAEGAGFGHATEDASLVSLEVGAAYRLKVSGIPNNFADVFPSVELIHRMHAPPGKELRYPIPIEITQEELEMALAGKYVVRVVYVEDPRRALPVREVSEQRYFEVMTHEDPFTVASNLGRPVAILRMGSLAPNPLSGPTSEFLFGSPPVTHHAVAPATVPYVPGKLKPEDLPADPMKIDAAPISPAAPQNTEEPATVVPAEIPEKVDIDEQPGPTAPAIEPADEMADPFGDDPFGDEPLGDDVGDSPNEADADPFGDF